MEEYIGLYKCAKFMECRPALENYPYNNEVIQIRTLLMHKTGKYGKRVIGKYLLKCNISLTHLFQQYSFFILDFPDRNCIITTWTFTISLLYILMVTKSWIAYTKICLSFFLITNQEMVDCHESHTSSITITHHHLDIT